MSDESKTHNMRFLPQFTDTGLEQLIGYRDENIQYEILTKPTLLFGKWVCLAKGWFGLAFIQIHLRPIEGKGND